MTWVLTLTYPDVLEVLTVAPEEGEPVQVDVTLDGEPGQLPEEALAEVQRLLPPEHLVPEQQPQGGDVGTGSGNK